LKGEDIASWVSLQKARTFISELSENDLIITADTIVWCKNQVLGKPENSEEARGMIKTLSGTDHEVITGVTIMSSLKIKTFTETTIVTFEEMTDEEISYYVEKFKPFDKAGAYGIQEWIGLAACTRIEGSYFNVVGMPVHRLYKELKEFVS
jgi:septum formation protein